MPLSLSYSKLYLGGFEMRDDLLNARKSIILTDTPLILYYPHIKTTELLHRALFSLVSFNVDLRNIFIMIRLIVFFITERRKISSCVFTAYLYSQLHQGNKEMCKEFVTAPTMFLIQWL